MRGCPPSVGTNMFIAVNVDEILRFVVLPRGMFAKANGCTVIEYLVVYYNNTQRWSGGATVLSHNLTK